MRWATVDDDGLPVVRYGFVGGVTGDEGPVVVMLDGELGGDVINPTEIEPVHMSNVTLILTGTDLLDDPSLRQGLVNLWVAEAETAGLEIAVAALHRQRCPRLERGIRARRTLERRRHLRPPGQDLPPRPRVRHGPRRHHPEPELNPMSSCPTGDPSNSPLRKGVR